MEAHSVAALLAALLAPVHDVNDEVRLAVDPGELLVLLVDDVACVEVAIVAERPLGAMAACVAPDSNVRGVEDALLGNVLLTSGPAVPGVPVPVVDAIGAADGALADATSRLDPAAAPAAPATPAAPAPETPETPDVPRAPATPAPDAPDAAVPELRVPVLEPPPAPPAPAAPAIPALPSSAPAPAGGAPRAGAAPVATPDPIAVAPPSAASRASPPPAMASFPPDAAREPAPPEAVETARAAPGLAPGAPRTAPAVVAAGAALAAAAGAALASPLLALYRRIVAQRALERPARRAVYDHVLAHPGCTCADAARATNVHFTTAEHHLRVLADVGLVTGLAAGPEVRYFENHGRYAAAEQEALALLARPANAEFVRAVAAAPGAGVGALARRLAIAKSTSSRRASILLSAGLVELADGGLRVTERARAALARTAT